MFYYIGFEGTILLSRGDFPHFQLKIEPSHQSCWITERGGESVIEKFNPF
jgi:hypothetical protein